MPLLETVPALAAYLADLFGIDGRGIHFVGMTHAASRAQVDWLAAHADDCLCRLCWIGIMERRIRAAVATEALLAQAEEFFHG